LALVALLLTAPPESEDPTRARLQFIEQSLAQAEPALACWYDGWLLGYTALTFGQTMAATMARQLESQPEDRRALRAGMVAGAATSAVGALALLLSRPTGVGAARALALMPDGTAEQRAAKLARAEALLRAIAEEEAMGAGWITHAANVAVNLVAGLVLWLGYDLLQDGAVTFGSGWAVGAVQIFSQPTQAIDDWAAYRRRFDGAASASDDTSVSWQVGLFPGGIGLALSL
jgi:hypothetical protein